MHFSFINWGGAERVFLYVRLLGSFVCLFQNREADDVSNENVLICKRGSALLKILAGEIPKAND